MSPPPTQTVGTRVNREECRNPHHQELKGSCGPLCHIFPQGLQTEITHWSCLESTWNLSKGLSNQDSLSYFLQYRLGNGEKQSRTSFGLGHFHALKEALARKKRIKRIKPSLFISITTLPTKHVYYFIYLACFLQNSIVALYHRVDYIVIHFLCVFACK